MKTARTAAAIQGRRARELMGRIRDLEADLPADAVLTSNNETPTERLTASRQTTAHKRRRLPNYRHWDWRITPVHNRHPHAVR